MKIATTVWVCGCAALIALISLSAMSDSDATPLPSPVSSEMEVEIGSPLPSPGGFMASQEMTSPATSPKRLSQLTSPTTSPKLNSPRTSPINFPRMPSTASSPTTSPKISSQRHSSFRSVSSDPYDGSYVDGEELDREEGSSPIIVYEDPDHLFDSSEGDPSNTPGGDHKRRRTCHSESGGVLDGPLPPEGNQFDHESSSDESYVAADCDISHDSGDTDSNSALSYTSDLSDTDSSVSYDITLDSDRSDIEIPESEFLYEDATVTVEEAVINLCDLYVKNRLTKAALSDVIRYTRGILPRDNLMPRSLYEFFNFIKRAAPPVEDRSHMYCPGCFSEKCEKEEDPCKTSGCEGKGGSYFYEFPLAQQIRFMFEHRGLAALVDEYHTTKTYEEGFISDLCDGSEIRKLKDTHNGPYDIAILWNVDGISLRDSDFHLWVCLFTFCQVPARMRPYLICVHSVWYDKKEPPMSLFLKPFVQSLAEIDLKGGVEWTHPQTKRKTVSKVAAPGASADAPARADLQKIKRYNSKNGCNTCEITCTPVKVPLKTTDGQVRETTRYYYIFKEQDAKLRTGKRMAKQAASAQSAKDKSVLGVKGVSPAEAIPYLDVGKFVYPEYMHSVLLGVVLSFTLLMVNFKSAWGLKKHIREIDQRLLSLEVPDFVKLPGRLSRVTKFHAHELRSWLLYFSLPILSSYLPEEYLQHWMLLVGGIYLLLKERISQTDVSAADTMLRIFVRDVGALYGETAYKYNTHQLLHQALTVRRFGPLSENSTFMFESFNGVITRMIHGTKHKARELVENVKIATGIMSLKHAATTEGSAQVCHCVLSNEADFRFSETDLAELARIGCFPFKAFMRAKIGKDVYTTELHDSAVRRCNSFIIVNINDCDEIAQILCFVRNTVNGEIWCFLQIYSVDHARYFVHRLTKFRVDHVIPIGKPLKKVFVPICKVQNKVIKVENFVCRRPNTVEVNL